MMTEKITTERETLQAALDALNGLLRNIRRNAPELSVKTMGDAEVAIDRLFAALAAQPAEPTIDTRAITSHPPSNTVTRWRIGTLEGGHDVSTGDWIITGVKGEHYPCKDEIFRMTYEPVTP